jgi:tryptophan-rich sensory protein
MQKILRIATVVMTCIAVGYFSGLVVQDNIETWYPTILKPFFNPPNWVFAPVWSILYVMMGVAAGLVWNRIDSDEANVKKAFKLFVIQLTLNAVWSFIFFSLHNPFLALIEIVLLWLLILETYTQFRKVDKTAGMLLVPYLLWVSFAMILNGSIWWLNR